VVIIKVDTYSIDQKKKMNTALSIDVMSGDVELSVWIDAILSFLNSNQKSLISVFGDNDKILDIIKSITGNTGHKRLNIVHAENGVSGDVKPSTYLRIEKKTSMHMAIDSVVSGECGGVLSGGNTGAYWILCRKAFGMMDGIDRPAIASRIPHPNGFSLMLDLGATSDCTNKTLLDFVIMGRVFAQILLKIKNPTFALLNVGSEEFKGKAYIHEANAMIKDRDIFSESYLGYIEGDKILSGYADVIVSDGFSGNISLKSIEGVAHYFLKNIKNTFSETLFSRICGYFLRNKFRNNFFRFNPDFYNGAMFLGLNHIAVKSHGQTTKNGIVHAIETTTNLIKNDVCKKLEEQLKNC
jgi:phosphate acyltransferase